MTPHILFRKKFDSDGESAIAGKYFPVTHLRTTVPKDSLVIGRFSCLPYYDELVADLATNGSSLINSLSAHSYIANFDYYYDIAEYTFPTWFEFVHVPFSKREAPFVVKGRTNSRKFQWKTHMFAKDFKAAVLLGSELMNDPFIGPQGLVIREYVPLQTFEIGLNDVPMTNEWRMFFYKGTLLASGYYWAILDDHSVVEEVRPDFEATGIPFAKKVAKILSETVSFFVLDIAKTAEGQWKVVEVNDGQQSGLNDLVDADELYRNLARALALEVSEQGAAL